RRLVRQGSEVGTDGVTGRAEAMASRAVFLKERFAAFGIAEARRRALIKREHLLPVGIDGPREQLRCALAYFGILVRRQTLPARRVDLLRGHGFLGDAVEQMPLPGGAADEHGKPLLLP